MTTAQRWRFRLVFFFFFFYDFAENSPDGTSTAKRRKPQACSCGENRRKSHVKRFFALFLCWCKKTSAVTATKGRSLHHDRREAAKTSAVTAAKRQ